MYQSDLSDQAWSQIEHFFKRSDPREAKSIHSKHTIVKGCAVIEQSARKYPSLRAFSADAGYCGASVEFVEKVLGLKLDIAKGVKGQWILLKKRWIVERTFAWFGGFRRLAKDFEILTNTAENMIRIAMIKVSLAKCII